MPGGMDERVVSMEFDNRKFEKNVKTSMKTLDDLKSALDFDKTSDSLDEFDKKFKKFGKENIFKDMDESVSSLRKGLGFLGDSAKSAFSQFAEITKITAMIRLAERAISRLESSIKKFTIQPISMGFGKYTTKISSIKTIANATGMAADDVNKSLDRLNWFTDETSASFEAMVQNIGKFTSVGKGLDESITAMQGIAAWGYHSGASVQEQNRAMYNLSQALGTGSVKLIDWKSIENAGMATKEFKEQAIAAAEAAGKLKRKGDKLFAGNQEVNTSNFNATLAKGWFTSDVLMDTLKVYGGFADKLNEYMKKNGYDTAKEAMDAMDEEREEDQKKYMADLKKLIQKGEDIEKEQAHVFDEVSGVTYKKTYEITKNGRKGIEKLAKETGVSADELEKEVQRIHDLSLTSANASPEEKSAAVAASNKAWEEFLKKYGLERNSDIEEAIFGKGGRNLKSEKYDPTKDIAKKTKMSEKQIKERVDKINKIADVKAREKEIAAFAKETGINVKDLTKILDGLAESEETLGEKAFKSSQQSKTFSDSVEATLDAVSTGWMNTFQWIFGGLDKSIQVWSDVTDILWDLFAAGSSARNNAFQHWAEEFNGWADLWGNGEDGSPLGVLHAVMDTIIELKELLGESFKNVFFPDLEKVIGTLHTDDVINIHNGLYTDAELRDRKEGSYMGKQLKNITESIRDFAVGIRTFLTSKDNIINFGKIFTAVANVLKFFGTIIKNVFGTITNFIKNSGILQDAINLFGRVSEKISSITEAIQDSGFIQTLFEKIGNTLTWFYNLIKKWVGQITDFFEESGIGPAIRDFFAKIGEFFLGGPDDIDENGKRTESAFFRSFGWVKNIKEWFEKIDLKAALNVVKDFIQNFGVIWEGFINGLNGKSTDKSALAKNGVSDNAINIVTSFEEFGKKLSGVWTFLKGIFDKIVGWLESSGILPAIRTAWDGIKTFFGNIGLVWEALTKGSVADPSKLDEKQKGLVEGVINFTQKLKNAWEKLKGWFTTAWSWLSEKFNLFVGWLESSGILPKLREWWEKIKNFFGNFGKTWEKIKLIANNFSTVWQVFVDALNGKKYVPRLAAAGGNTKASPLMKILMGVSDFGTKLSGVFQFIKGIIDKIKGWLESSGILPWIRQAWSDVKGFFEGMFSGGSGGEGEGIIDKIKNFFINIWEAIKNFFSGEDGGPVAKIKEFFSGGIFETIKGWFVGENSIFKKIGDFIGGLFGSGGESAGKAASEAVSAGGKAKKGGFFQNIIDAFTNSDTGQFDLVKGLSTGIVKLIETVGAIDWVGISSNIFGIVVDVINGLDDACGKLHIDNIIRVIKRIVGAFTGLMIAKTITDITSTIRTIVKKGKDKSMFEKFNEILQTIGTMLLQIGIAIALIAASMWLISMIKPDRFAAAAITMGLIGVFLIGFLVVAAKIGKKGINDKTLADKFRAIGTMFLYMAVSIALIVVSIIALSMISTANLIKGGLAVVAILGVMSIVILLMAKFSKDSGTLKLAGSIATFAGLAILIATMTICIILLQHVEIGKAIVSAILLGALLLAIAAAIKIMNKVKINAKSMATMIIMAVIIGIITAAFVLLKDVPAGHLIEIAKTIAIVLATLIGAVALCTLLGPKALIGAAVLAGALVIIAAGLAGVALLANGVMNNVVTFMSSLAAVSNSAKLVDIQAIRNAFDALPIISSALANVGTVDVRLALNLVQAAWDVFTKLKLASYAAQLIDEKQYDKVFGKDGKSGILQKVQTAMSSVTDTGWKASALGRSVETLAENLKLVGQAGADLSKDAGGKTLDEGIQIVKEKLSDIQEIVKMAIDMSTIGEDKTIDSDFLTKFSAGVANIGAALKLYNEALATFETDGANGAKGITESDIAPVDSSAISTALQSVMAVLGSATFDGDQIAEVEKWGGLDSASGNNGGTLFALGLTNIATAMTSFAKSATDFNSDDVDKAITSLDKLAEIKGKFETNSPNDYKGMMDDVATWGDGGNFKTAIVGMGTAIAAFGTTVKDLPENAVSQATNALDTLAVIYEKLKGEGTVEGYLAKIGSLTIGGSTTTTQSVETTFQSFASGISKLADGLAAFSGSLTNKDIGYDQEKVDAAVKILENMAAIETNLKTVNVDTSWWDRLLFGENGIKKLGENMSGLGSRLSTFSQELSASGSFDIDVDGDLWKNVKGVIEFFAGIWKDLYTMSDETKTFDESGGVVSSVAGAGGNLIDLGSGIDEIREAMVTFNESMQKERTGGSGNLYKLGEWDSDNWENIKTVINTFKDIAYEMKNSSVAKSDLQLLDDLGLNIQKFFDHINYNGNNLAKVMERMSVPEGSENVAANFASFIGSIQNLADAAGTLHAKDVNDEDIQNVVGLFQSIVGIAGGALGDEFLNGFALRISQTDTGEDAVGTTVGGAIEAMIGIIDSYSEKFFDSGKTAGAQYASGFKEGMKEVQGFLTPIEDLDADKKSSSNGKSTSLAEILASMKYPTTTDMTNIIDKFNTLNGKFDKQISVKDQHGDIVGSVGKVESKLKTISDTVSNLKKDINNLKIYLDSKTLVGGIAADMDAALGSRSKSVIKP